ncbi:MAG: class I SAM-dependent methyltransferase [Pseudomonadota bacterium]|nr:class I SAM-dependent methyltransferase [Pseudomonadota bacterium]
MSNLPGATQPLGRQRAKEIAAAFASDRSFAGRWAWHYSRGKLATDPLYPGVCDALRGSRAPLLDLGCGLGLLAHALHAERIDLAYTGVDNDEGKIRRARTAADSAALPGVSFECVDLVSALPEHRGSVAILDMLQYIDPQAQSRLLAGAIAMLTPGALLVIRTGLEDGSQRARLTHAVDAFANVLGWMNASPKRYPNAEELQATFDAAGLQSQFSALYGNTPFNNWRIVARMPG